MANLFNHYICVLITACLAAILQYVFVYYHVLIVWSQNLQDDFWSFNAMSIYISDSICIRSDLTILSCLYFDLYNCEIKMRFWPFQKYM